MGETMKRTTLILAAIAAALALGGCDKILEQFYPEITVDAWAQQSDYSVGVSVEYSSSFTPSTFSDSKPICVALIPFYETYNGFQVDQSSIMIQRLTPESFRTDGGEPDGFDRRTTVYFDTWSYSTYRVLVWSDANNNSWIQIDGTSADENGVIALETETANNYLDFRYSNPAGAGADMSCLIEPTSVVNVAQLTANPYATYSQGVGNAPFAYIYSEYGYNVPLNQEAWFRDNGSYDPDYDDWINRYEWVIVDQYGGEIAWGSGNAIAYTFAYEGNYTVKLRVYDKNNNASAWATYGIYAYPTASETTLDQQSGSISGPMTWSVYLPNAGYYTIHWEDSYNQAAGSTYSGDILVTCNPFFLGVDSGYTSPQQIYVGAAQWINLDLSLYSESTSGTYRIWVTYVP